MVTSGQFLPGLWLPSSEVEGNAAIRLHCCGSRLPHKSNWLYHASKFASKIWIGT